MRIFARKQYILLATSAMSLGVAAPLWAQQSTEGAGAGDIIVTARRTEERLQDVPISITVLSQGTIAQRNIYSTADLGNYVPSLSVNQQFGPEKSSFVIRGFTQAYHTAPTVGVYFADVIAPRAVGGNTSGNGAGVGSLFDLENIQVLKGPQGTLFGRNTTGGAILLVPTKPKDTLGGYVEGSLGNYDMHRIQAALNVPMSDTFRLRAAVDWNQRDGYLKNHSGIGPDRYDNANYIAARLSLVGDLTPSLENYTILSYSHSRTHGDVPTATLCNPASPLSFFSCAQIARRAARGDGLSDVESNFRYPLELIDQWQAINTTTWTASDNLTVKNIISYAQYRSDDDLSLLGDNFVIPPGIPGAGRVAVTSIQLQKSPRGHSVSQSTFTEELQLIGNSGDGRFNWQAGAYLEISRPLGWSAQRTTIFINCNDVQTLDCTPTTSGSIADAGSKDWFNNKGLYAQATYKLTDEVSLTGGFRYTMDRQRELAEYVTIFVPTTPGNGMYACTNRVLFHGPGGFTDPLFITPATYSMCDAHYELSSNRPTWLVGLDYRPTENIMMYAKYSRGYRMGSITANSIGLETVGPEKVDTYEIGTKLTFRGAFPGYFNVAGFYNDFRDQQLPANAIVAPCCTAYISPASPTINAGKSRMWGFEIDASVRAFQQLRVDLGYTYLNTKLLEFSPPPTPPYYSALLPATDVGAPLALSPKNRVTVSATYTLPLDESVGRISFGATFVHTDANRASTPAVTPLYLTHAQNQLNLNADWESVLGRPIDFAFFMTNATNQGLIVFPSQSINVNGLDGGHVNQPRMWGFRLRYHFGK